MLILQVISSMDPANGGVAQAVSTLVEGLMKQGVDSEILCLDAEGSPFLATFVTKVVAVGPARGPWAFAWGLVTWLMANLQRFDAVIVHGLWLYPSFASHRALQSFARRTPSSLRWYVMPHGMLDPYFQRDPSRRFKAIRNRIYWRLIERAVVNDSQGLLFTCEQERLLAREPFPGYFPKSEAVVGMGVQDPPDQGAGLEEAFRKTCPLLGARSFVLFMGRIHPKKGVDLILRAYVREAMALHGEGRAVPSLVIAGPLSSSYADEMQALARDLVSSIDESCRPLILFPGMLRGDQKWGALANCEAFVLSSHQENFGIAVVEALASSKPVLISREVNIWREIEPVGAGFVEKDDLDGAANLLRRWFKLSEEERLRMGRNARQCYLDNFQVTGAAKRLLDAISSHPESSEERRLSEA